MWYKVDINALAWQLLPNSLCKLRLLAFVWALLRPLKTLHYTWRQYRESNIYKLAHNGQVCYLRKALNDQFDPELRRIYIGDGSRYDSVYVFMESELQNEPHVYTEREEETVWIFTEGETADTGADFIVYVPTSLMAVQNFEIRAVIDFYKLGGMRYIIIEIDE